MEMKMWKLIVLVICFMAVLSYAITPWGDAWEQTAEAITVYDPQNAPTDTTHFGFNKTISYNATITRLFAECDSSGYSIVMGTMDLGGGSVTVIDTLTLTTAGVNCYKVDITSGFDNSAVAAGKKFWFKSLGSEDPTYLYLMYTYKQND